MLKLIFLYGLPATGKLTVAKELAALTGYRLFHNHLVVDCLLPVFEFGSAPFVELREQIWLSVMEQAGHCGLLGMIFTFAPEATVREGFPAEAVRVVESTGGMVLFAELTCPMAELKARLENPSRRQYQKLASVELFEDLHAKGVFKSPQMPEPAVTIDTGRFTAQKAAQRILEAMRAADGWL